MQFKNIKNKIIANISIILSVILLIIFFVLIPTIKSIKMMNKQIESQKIELEKKYKFGQSFKSVKKNTDKALLLLKKFDNYYISKNRSLELITYLESLANKYNLEQTINLNLNNLKKIDKSNSQISILPFELYIKGRYPDLIEFIYELEKSKYSININSLFFNQDFGEDNKRGGVNMLLRANTFFK